MILKRETFFSDFLTTGVQGALSAEPLSILHVNLALSRSRKSSFSRFSMVQVEIMVKTDIELIKYSHEREYGNKNV